MDMKTINSTYEYFQKKCNYNEWKTFTTTYGDTNCRGCGKLLFSVRNRYNYRINTNL